MTTAELQKYERLSRERLFAQQPPPMFQMLYLLAGHEAWYEAVTVLKNRLRAEYLTPELAQEVFEHVTGDNLEWFFDYWCHDGTGFPSYKIRRAFFHTITTGIEEKTEYLVQAEIENLGTGRMPVPLLLTTSKKPMRDKIWIGAGETVHWEIRSSTLPKSLHVDPQGWIYMAPWFDEETKSWIQNPHKTVEPASAG